MYAFSNDGKHLLFQDAFGLTRLTFPKGLKTDKTLGGWDLTLAGSRVLVSSARSRKRALRSIDDMMGQVFKSSDYEHYALCPDDKHALRLGYHEFAVVATEKGDVASHRWPADLQRIEGIELSPKRPNSSTWVTCGVVSEDEVVAHYCADAERGVIYVGALKKGKTFEPWYMIECGRLGARPILIPSKEAVVIGAFDRSLGKARLYRIAADRSVERWEIDAIGEPSSHDGAMWAWQRDEATICQADWRELDKPVRYTLPQEAQGAGRVMAHGERVMFVPFDGERIVDVVGAKILDRKLSAAERPAREGALAIVRKYDAWLAREGGAMRAGSLDIQPKRKTTYWSPEFDLGRCSLSAFMAFGDMVNDRLAGERDISTPALSSYSNPSGITSITLDEVRRAFQAIETFGATFSRAFCGLEHALDEYYEPEYADRHAKSVPRKAPLFEPAAGAVLLRALLQLYRAPTADLALSSNIDVWASKPLSAEEFANVTVGERSESGDALDGGEAAPRVALYIVMELLGADALPVFIRWTVDDETAAPYAKANAHIISKNVARFVQFYPEIATPYRQACKTAKGGQGKSMLQSLDFELGA